MPGYASASRPRGEQFRCTAKTASGERCRSKFTFRHSDPPLCNRHISPQQEFAAAERQIEDVSARFIEAWRRGEIPLQQVPAWIELPAGVIPPNSS
jgi:hypothetical protein